MTRFILSARATQEIAYLRTLTTRMDAVLLGLQQQLEAGGPLYDQVANEEGLRCAEARPFPEVPPLRVWYLYDEQADEARIKLFTFDGEMISLS